MVSSAFSVRIAAFSLLSVFLLACNTTTPISPRIGDVDTDNRQPELYRSGALTAVEPTVANGVVQLLQFSGNLTRISVQLNIEPLAGTEYVAWLTGDAAATKILTTLQQPFDDVRHLGSFEVTEDLSRYSRVVISREATGQQLTEPTEIVAQATLVTQPLNK